MTRKAISLMLCCLLLISTLGGCNTVVDIASSVANAAMKELEKQVKEVLAENKVEIIEVQSAVGKLNDQGGNFQIFCAALIKPTSLAIPQGCADTLDKLFEEAGLIHQTGRQVESEHLVHKQISFKFSDFDNGGEYYVLYVYTSDFSIDLPEFTLPSGDE